MSRSVRLFDLANLLAGRRSRTLGEIVEQLEVSERTAYRDLAELGRMVPLVRDEAGYRLMDGATLRPLNLSTREYALLKVALREPSLRQHDSLRGTLRGLEGKLDAVVAQCEESPEVLTLAGVVRFGTMAKGVLEGLEAAITDEHRVEILYTSLSGGTRRWRQVDPWRLFERDGAWYLVAHCHENREPRMFRLDRILELAHRHEGFELPEDFDLERFLAGSWGVYVGKERFAIELRFDPSVAPLLLHGRHHAEEEVEQRPDGSIDYRVELTSLDEIARWVLGFGDRVEILAPEELRERVAELARAALAALDRHRG